LQYTWQEYAQAITSTGCNFASPTTATVICPDAAALSDTAGINIATPASPCQQVDLLANNAAQTIYQLRTQQLLASFDSAYLAKSFGVQEGFTVFYTPKEYHYTLYYYDEAGNLVKTVPPKGVHPDFTNSAAVEAAKLAGTDVLMPHTFTTNYRYNSLNQVIDQKTPDADTSRFWYDQLGRMVVSQNGQQVKDGKYSYTIYDALGRITEVGQKPQSTPMTQTISRDTTALKSWLAGASPREQITYTVYDLPSIISGTYITQQYLRNRVSYSYTKNAETDLALFAATYYTYDIHGNVDTLVQDYDGVTAMSNNQNRFKVIAYTYDLISGKVNTVDYQPGHIDAFHHRYNYDASNRLVDVYTSRDSIVWERDATYRYYKHGPLARTTLGQLQVQGIDYSYTLQGWLKGINQVFGGSQAISNGNGCATGTGLDELVVNYRTSNTPQQYTARKRISLVPGFRSGDASDYFYTNLDSSIQPCQLASQGNNNAFATEIAPVANDAYGVSLHYYSGDYKSIASTGTTSLLDGLGTAAAPLYNGNIAAMAVNIPILGNPLVYNYHYDQLNRITRLDAYNGLNPTTGIFTPVQINDYKERLNYDPNGNIMGYLRNGATSINVALDSLHYKYTATTNQLNYVTDNVAAINYTEDIDNQTTNNYTYDAIGNLNLTIKRRMMK
jgi:YD repeat-containing protein